MLKNRIRIQSLITTSPLLLLLKKRVKENQKDVPYNSLDNPGGWSNYTYHSKFAGVGGHGDYIKHEMPAGARPVPINEETGKRTSGDREFFYKGRQQHNSNPNFVWQGVYKECIFPDNCRAKLDDPLLKKMGLAEEHMKDGDALFFHQLLVPFVDLSRSDIPDYPRMAFILMWPNLSTPMHLL